MRSFLKFALDCFRSFVWNFSRNSFSWILLGLLVELLQEFRSPSRNSFNVSYRNFFRESEPVICYEISSGILYLFPLEISNRITQHMILKFLWKLLMKFFQGLFKYSISRSSGIFRWFLLKFIKMFHLSGRPPISLQNSLRDFFQDFLRNYFIHKFRECFWDSFRDSLSSSFRDSSRIFFLGTSLEISILLDILSPLRS